MNLKATIKDILSIRFNNEEAERWANVIMLAIEQDEKEKPSVTFTTTTGNMKLDKGFDYTAKENMCLHGLPQQHCSTCSNEDLTIASL